MVNIDPEIAELALYNAGYFVIGVILMAQIDVITHYCNKTLRRKVYKDSKRKSLVKAGLVTTTITGGIDVAYNIYKGLPLSAEVLKHSPCIFLGMYAEQRLVNYFKKNREEGLNDNLKELGKIDNPRELEEMYLNRPLK